MDFPELIRWNAWANRQVLETLQRSGGEPVSALAAFQHVLETETVWLRRFDADPRPMLKLWDMPSLALAAELSAECGTRWQMLAARLSDPAALQQTFTYTNSRGESFTDPIEGPLIHTLMHSSQYRGEAAGFLNAAAHRVPDLDLIFWQRLGRPE